MAVALKTVLIADDEITVCSLLQRAATRLGYEVVGVAHDGGQALAQVQSKKPNVGLMDIHMPEMDGLQATRQITPLETTAVVIITADQEPDSAREAMDLGACGYILKPFDVNEVGPILEAAWHRFVTLKAMKEESRALVDQLETRKLMEKAKGILMKQQGLPEEAAHRSLQQMSQDHGISLKETCRSILQVGSEESSAKSRTVFARKVAAEIERRRITDVAKS